MSSLKKTKHVVILRDFEAEVRRETRGQAVQWKVRGIREQVAGRQFTLHLLTANRWRISGRNSSGSTMRVRINANTLEEAIYAASAALYPLPPVVGAMEYDLATAFSEAVAALSIMPDSKADLIRKAGYFIDWWCGGGYLRSTRGLTSATASLWINIEPRDVGNYMHYLMEEHIPTRSKDGQDHLTGSTVNHYLEPLRKTSRYMHRNWRTVFADICEGYSVPKNFDWDASYDDDDGNPFLSFADLFNFIDWLDSHEFRMVLITGVMLQGFMALQLQEALRLRWDDVDLANGTIIIQGHDDTGDRPKNRYRVRKLPLARHVLTWLRAMPREHRCVVPYDHGYNAYGSLLGAALDRWRPDLDIPPKDLRNSLSTHAQDNQAEERWNLRILERFMGHAPTGVREKHYYGDKKGRLAQLYAKTITPKIDAAIDQVLAERRHRSSGNPVVDPSENVPTARIIEIADAI